MNCALVTGGAGFLGFHLCEKLLNDGFKVIAVDNLITGQIENIHYLSDKYSDNFIFINADITKTWDSWLPRILLFKVTELKYVFHFASVASPHLFRKYSLEIMEANSTGLQHAIHYADQFQARVIFASTSEIYGSEQQTAFSESHWGYVNSFGERSCYNEAKRFGEAIIFSSNQRNNTQHGLVRIFNTYGPRMRLDDERVIPYFIMQCLRRLPLSIHQKGLQTRSFCYVDDLIEAILIYTKADIKTPMNLGKDDEISILNLALLITKILNQEVSFIFKDPRTDDPTQRRPNLELALQLLNPWTPKVSLEIGIERTSQYLKEKFSNS